MVHVLDPVHKMASTTLAPHARVVHLAMRNVALNGPPEMRGSRMAYGPPAASSRSRNCVSGGTSLLCLPQEGIIHLSAAHYY